MLSGESFSLPHYGPDLWMRPYAPDQSGTPGALRFADLVAIWRGRWQGYWCPVISSVRRGRRWASPSGFVVVGVRAAAEDVSGSEWGGRRGTDPFGVCVCVLSHVRLFVTSWAIDPARLLCPWNSPG